MPMKFFGTVRQKIFNGKSWYSPLSLSYPIFFDTRNYCNSEEFPYGNFRQCETKKSDGKSWYSPPHPLSLIQTFSVPEISETLKGSPTKLFGTVRQKIFDRKSWNSPPPLMQTFSTPEIIPTVKDSPTQIFGIVRRKIFDGKSWYSPPSPLIQTFSLPEFIATVKDSPTEIFGTVRQKIFDGKSW